MLPDVFGLKGMAASVAVTALVVGGPAYLKGRKDVKANWDKAIAEAQEQAREIEDNADEINDKRDAIIDEGKEEQRGEDMVTRQLYTDLKEDLSDERRRFENLLWKYTQGEMAGDSCNCAIEPMPEQLQRRASNGTDRND